MPRRRRLRRALTLALAFAVVACAAAWPDEVEKRFRISLIGGGYDFRDEVRSSSANILTLVNDAGAVVDRYVEPRDDAAIASELELESASTVTLAAQYGLGRNWLLEASVGYTETELEQIEIQAMFVLAGSSIIGIPSFETFRLPAGEMTRVPIQVSAVYRFRPQAKLKPYLGAGAGYSIVGYEPSPELDALSAAMDRSEGFLALLSPESHGPVSINGLQQPRVAIDAAEVDAKDSFEWQLIGGVEFQVAQRWALVTDLRYTFVNHPVTLSFDNGNSLGNPVPQTTANISSPTAIAPYGPLRIVDGGLLDLTGNGDLDPGLYYVQGGSLDLDGISLQIGVRYTF
ncbi:MAG: outer membrane beta-barrel protein [bacterium]|nr:outer membrane beta-barrel protein [bacterium]